MDPRITVIVQLVDISPTETNRSRRPAASELVAAVVQANLDLRNLSVRGTYSEMRKDRHGRLLYVVKWLFSRGSCTM